MDKEEGEACFELCDQLMTYQVLNSSFVLSGGPNRQLPVDFAHFEALFPYKSFKTALKSPEKAQDPSKLLNAR